MIRRQALAGVVVGALLVGLTITALVAFRPHGAPPVPGALAPTALTKIGTGTHALTVDRTEPHTITRLEGVLPRVTPAAALDDHQHHTATCPSTARAALPVAPAATTYFCWDVGDATGAAWTPHGVAVSSAMASDLGLGGRRVLATSWTSSSGETVRITLADVTHGASAPYVDLLPIVPATSGSGAPTYRQVGGGGGGLAWFGDYLFLTDVQHGIRVFDLRHMVRAPAAGSPYPAALGAAYLLPQVEYVRQPTAAHACADTVKRPVPSPGDAVCFSWMSLDREDDGTTLVVGERRQDVAGGRILRYPLDARHYLPVPGKDGAVHPTQAFASPVISMHGAVAIAGRFYVASGSKLTHGRLYVTAPGRPATATTCGPASSSSDHCWSIAPENLAYWPGRAEIWSLTNAVQGGRSFRVVFDIRTAELPTRV